MNNTPDTPENDIEPLIDLPTEEDDSDVTNEVDLAVLISTIPPGPARKGVFVRALKYINAYAEDL